MAISNFLSHKSYIDQPGLIDALKELEDLTLKANDLESLREVVLTMVRIDQRREEINRDLISL